ncbi:MAG: MATE family efflux transporter [Bacillota bacterium]
MENQRIRDFTEGNIPRHLMVFALPMLLGNLLQALYNTVDSIWVGRFLGPDALAAVSVGFPIIFALVALIMGVTMATTVLVSQYFGAHQPDQVVRTVNNSLLLLAVLGAAVSAAGIVLRRPLLALINTPPEIIDAATAYLGIFMSGLVPMFLYNAAGAVRRIDRVHETVKWAVLLSGGITLMVSLLAFFRPDLFILLFTRDQAVLLEGGRCLRHLAFAYVPLALMFAMAGVLRGAGDTIPPMFITLVSLWVVRVPLASYLSSLPAFGVAGVWTAIAVSPYVGLTLYFLYYQSGRWQAKVVARREPEAEPPSGLGSRVECVERA